MGSTLTNTADATVLHTSHSGSGCIAAGGAAPRLIGREQQPCVRQFSAAEPRPIPSCIKSPDSCNLASNQLADRASSLRVAQSEEDRERGACHHISLLRSPLYHSRPGRSLIGLSASQTNTSRMPSVSCEDKIRWEVFRPLSSPLNSVVSFSTTPQQNGETK